MKKVAGWADFTSAPGWDDDFTVVKGLNKVDLQWASRDVLLALPGITPNMVDRFLQIRQGPDGIEGTADDMQFKNISDAAMAFGVRADQLEQQPLASLITVNSNIYRVVSVGTAGTAKRTVQMVFNNRANPPSVYTWKEF